MKATILIAFAVLAATAPAHAQEDCIAAIRAAVQDAKAAVPEKCWRFGPLTLGMTPARAEAALGPPDATEPVQGMLHGQSFPAQRTIYVYPRDLATQIKEHPVRRSEFRPLSLQLTYEQDRLVAIGVGASARVDFVRCTATDDDTGPPSEPAAFPYSFYGIALGSPRDKVIRSFGPFHGSNNSKDFWTYWPVPISIDGEERVGSLYIASTTKFAGLEFGAVHYVADQDPPTCRIRGFRIQTDAKSGP